MRRLRNYFNNFFLKDKKSVYMLLGLLQVLAFTLQDLLNYKVNFLTELQSNHIYKYISGSILLFFLIWLCSFSYFKYYGNLKEKLFIFKGHKRTALFCPFIYYLHSTKVGYGFLVLLFAGYFLAFFLGLLIPWVLKYQAKKYQFYINFHISLAATTIFLSFFHLYITIIF